MALVRKRSELENKERWLDDQIAVKQRERADLLVVIREEVGKTIVAVMSWGLCFMHAAAAPFHCVFPASSMTQRRLLF
jgi:hypothetical protein